MKFKSALTAFVACAAAVASFTSRATALPDGYIRCDYVESTVAGKQYIDTGVLMQDNLATKVDYVYTSFPSDGTYMLAANGVVNGALNNREYTASVNGSGQWRVGDGDLKSVATATIPAAKAGNRYLVQATITGKSVALSVTDKTAETAAKKTTVSCSGLNAAGDPRTLGLFALHSGTSPEGSYSYFSPTKVYSCQIYTDTTVLARDFQPCWEVSSHQFGLYDVVGKAFYPSEGTTPFAGTIAVSVIAAGEGIDSVATGFSPSQGQRTLAWNGTSGIEFTAPAEFMASAGRKGTVTGGTLYEIVGTTTNQLATTDTTTLTGQPNGYPLLMVWSATYSDGVVGAKDFYADPVNGDDDYAGEDIGSAEHPFKTLGKAHIAATNHIKTASAKAVIWLAEGRFDQKVRITFAAGESWIGKGKDKTFINASGCSTTGSDYGYLRLVSSDNLLSSVCVTGFVGGISKTIWVEKGLVDHCRSAYNAASGNSSYGRGIYIVGGTVRFSEFDHNSAPDMHVYGVGVWMSGGKLEDCLVHDNSGSGRDQQGGGINISGTAIVRRCRIYNNASSGTWSDDKGEGVYISGGTLENSVIFGNTSKGSADHAAGVHNIGGTVRYCTIYNNKSSKDVKGVSGYYQSKEKATSYAYNNIIFGNYKPGATVSAGTCRTNLLDAAISGYSLNFVTEDVGFVDAKNGDFHIASAASPAVGKALVISDVTTDFEGTVRDPAKPTIGAYEYVAAAEDFSVVIRVMQSDWREGSAPSVELVVSGAPDESKLSISWFLDGTEVPAAANLKTPLFAGASLGRHTVKAIATYNGETETAEKTDAFAVLPTKVYVNATGTGTFPFATFETGTNSLDAALGALWKDNNETTTVEVDEGTYRLSAVVTIQFPIAIVGRGAEKTHLRGFDTNARLITLDNAGARLCGLTLTNSVSAGGLAIKSGLVDGCQIIRCNSTEYEGRGAGVNISGGTLQNSEIVDCTMNRDTAGGGGVAVVGTGTIVSNCTIRACVCNDYRAIGGGGVVGSAGTMTHCRILDCQGNSNNGAAVLSTASGFTMRNCLIVGNRGTSDSVVRITAGTMENCTVADNTMPAGVAAVNCGGTVRNCVVWNGCADIAVNGGSVSYSCYSNATEGEDGNTAEDPKFRGVKHGEYKISSKSKAFRAGTVRGWMTGATDILGNPRLTDDKVDMGCYQVGFDPGLMILVW